MKEIKLLQLEIENFKGCAFADIEFGGRDGAIYGRNGAGKSTIYDALCWLLFGKDSKGNATFDLMPLENGEEKHGVSPEVVAVLSVDGEQTTLRRVYSEIWTKKRGSTDAVLTGHTTDFFTDGVPRTETEYKQIVGGLVGEDAFRLLTSVYRFCRDIKWQDRRKMLFDMCHAVSDAALLAALPQCAELAGEVGKLTVDDYKKALTAQRRTVNGALDELPARIDECERSAGELAAIDFDGLRLQLDEMQTEREARAGDLVKMDNDTAQAEAKNQLDALANERNRLEQDNLAHRCSQAVPVEDPRATVRAELEQIKARLREASAAASDAHTQIEMGSLRLDDYRKRWREIDREKAPAAGVCPTCGQTMPADKVAAAKTKFEADKKARQDALLADSELLKKTIAEQGKVESAKRAEVEKLSAAADKLTNQLATMRAPEPPVIDDLPGYVERAAELNDAITEGQKQLHEIVTAKDDRRATLQTEVDRLDGVLNSIREGLAKEAQLDGLRARVDELKGQQRELAAEIERIDRLIDQCDEFGRCKVDSITDAVNAMFRMARFRLFDTQLNGGVRDCCDVMWDGRPYAALSDGEKVKIGLDVMQTLSDFYGVRVPLFVDGAESVTDFPSVTSQVIRLCVSDEELRIAV